MAPSRELVDAVMDGYVSWREASAAVAQTYDAWKASGPDDRTGAFYRYRVALDEEERAAEDYRRLVELVQAA